MAAGCPDRRSGSGHDNQPYCDHVTVKLLALQMVSTLIESTKDGVSDLPPQLRNLPALPAGLPRTGGVMVGAVVLLGVVALGAGVGLRRFWR